MSHNYGFFSQNSEKKKKTFDIKSYLLYFFFCGGNKKQMWDINSELQVYNSEKKAIERYKLAVLKLWMLRYKIKNNYKVIIVFCVSVSVFSHGIKKNTKR